MSDEQSASTSLWRDVVLRLVIGFAVLAVLTHLVVRPFQIPSESMEPTLAPGDRVVARVVAVDENDLPRGAIVAFGHGESWADDRLASSGNPLKEGVRYVGDLLGIGPSHTAHTVKRVVGRPGERVRCCDDRGRVEINGEGVDEPFVVDDLPFTANSLDCSSTPVSQRCFGELTVPDGSYLVLGDNRANSADSVLSCRGTPSGREPPPGCARYVRPDQVVGVVPWRVWPLPPSSLD